jgi:DNA primase
MIQLEKRTINVSVQDVLTTLLTELQTRGINYLRILKPNGNNIQTCCPYHSEGLEKNPSAGISLNGNQKNPAGTFHCFACGKVASIQSLVSHCFGFDDNGRQGERWLLDNFISREFSDRKGIILKTLHKLNSVSNVNDTIYITEEELNKYRFYHPYMYQRKLTDEIINKFDVGYDKETNCLTFPCNDINGNCLFITRRSVITKFFNMPTDIDKPVYALDKVEPTTKELVVVESIINALTLWSWGIPAVALLGTGTNQQYTILENYPVRKYILALDGDDAGRKAVVRFRKKVKSKLIETYIMPEGKDVNDLTYEDFKKLKKEGIENL